jgi:hypothetical protein
MNQSRLTRNHKLIKPKLQKPRKNEDGVCFVPTIVNGVNNVNLNTKFEPKYSDSVRNLINKPLMCITRISFHSQKKNTEKY